MTKTGMELSSKIGKKDDWILDKRSLVEQFNPFLLYVYNNLNMQPAPEAVNPLLLLLVQHSEPLGCYISEQHWLDLIARAVLW